MTRVKSTAGMSRHDLVVEVRAHREREALRPVVNDRDGGRPYLGRNLSSTIGCGNPACGKAFKPEHAAAPLADGTYRCWYCGAWTEASS